MPSQSTRKNIKTLLYLVARWGNNAEGPNGSDTLFVVAASSHQSAAKIVDKVLESLPHETVRSKSNWIALLGEADGQANFSGIVHGPVLGQSSISGGHYFWSREVESVRWARIV